MNKIKKISGESDKADTAHAIYNQLIKNKQVHTFSKFFHIAGMRELKKNDLWESLGYSSFELMCCQPDIDIDLTPETIKKYIKIMDDLEAKGVEEAEMKGIGINRLGIIRQATNPKKYLLDATVLGYKDLKNKIYKNEKGIDIDKRQEEKAIDKADIGCQHWNGKCKLEKF